MMALDEKVEFGQAKQMLTQDSGDFSEPEPGNLIRLDLACGQKKPEGWTGVDKYFEGEDIVKHDLEVYPWPFKDESVYEIMCNHYVEHIPGQYGLNKFMEEVYRILMPLGTIRIQAPYYTSQRAWQDPTHVRAITDITFNYYDRSQLENIKMDHYFGKVDFEILTLRHMMSPEWESRGDEARRWAAKHFFNTVDDILVVMRKRLPKEE
jgi:predicted SAM-dependent methyltransferase